MRRVGVVREEVASNACAEGVRATWSNFLCPLDLRLCGTLVQRLKHVVQVWCTEFDASVDNGELQRDPILSKCPSSQVCHILPIRFFCLVLVSVLMTARG